MSWNICGSYFETCSCNVVCPCTASLALGATLDRCKVTLVFHVRDGDVERNRCRWVDGGGHRRHPEGDDGRELARWRFHRRSRLRRAGGEARRCVLGGTGRSDGVAWSADLREPRRAARCPSKFERMGCATRCGSVTQWTSRSRTWCRSAWRRATREAHRHLPSGRLGAECGSGNTLRYQRVRDRLRGQSCLLHISFLVVSLDAAGSDP